MRRQDEFNAVQFVTDHRVVTVDILRRLKGKSWEAARKELERSEGRGLLRSHWWGPLKYWVLSRASVNENGLSRRRARPFGREQLIRALARIYVTLLPGVGRVYTERELSKAFPGLGLTGADYLLDVTDETPCLGVLAADTGSDVRRLFRKLKEILQRHEDLDCPVSVWVVTSNEPKRETVEEALARSPFSGPVRVALVPELHPLVCLERTRK